MRAHPLAIALAVCLSACAGARRTRTITERIGGQPRVRSFASATAYEAFLRAEIAVTRGDHDEAVRQMELASFADDSDGWLAARRAEVFLLAGVRDEALEAAQTCARRFAEQAACWIVLGEALAANGRQPEATAAYSRALSVAPDDPEVRAAVSLGQGGSAVTAARARESAPDARPGDRTVAMRSLLDAGREARPTLASVRRARAREALDRGAFSAVDALLTPLYSSGRATLEDRLRLIDARVRDGRPGDAVALVEGLSIGAAERGVSRTERARLWLAAGRPAQALEEAERERAEGHVDARARRVLGTALVRVGRAAQGLQVLATIGPDEGEFVEAQVEAAEALARAARSDWGDRALVAAITRLGVDPGRAIDRDRLRAARARMFSRRGDVARAREALATVETPWGRQQRGVILARVGPASEVIRDLRERCSDRAEDSRADAHLVMACGRQPSLCSETEVTRALIDAQRGAAEDPATYRARAERARDASEARALRARAQELDPTDER